MNVADEIPLHCCDTDLTPTDKLWRQINVIKEGMHISCTCTYTNIFINLDVCELQKQIISCECLSRKQN